MRALSVIIVVNKGKENAVSPCLKGIGLFNEPEGLNIIVADNGAGLDSGQFNDSELSIAYADMEGEFAYGDVIKQVIEGFEIKNDILLLNPCFICTPGSLQSLYKTVYSDPEIGICGCVSNGILTGGQYISDYSSFDEAVSARSRNSGACKPHRILAPYEGAVYLKKDVLDTISGFDLALISENAGIIDISLQAISKGYRAVYSEDAFFWALPFYEMMEKRTLDNAYLEKKWGMHYFNVAPNVHIAGSITRKDNAPFKVLEIGCDCGATLMDIKNTFPQAEIYGLELNPSAAKISGYFSDTIVANIEEENVPYEDKTFDYIIFGDVLEHLRNPERVVGYCGRLLKDDGHIIASIPNIMHISVMRELLNGDFTYEETGLLDKTHIHFFTAKEIMKMFMRSSFHVDTIESVAIPISDDDENLIDYLMQRSGPDVFREMYSTFQYLCSCSKT